MDGDTIWCVDEAVKGLFQVNRFTYKVKCALSPSRLFKYGKIKITTVFKWEDMIVLVPEKLECFWIIYNKVTEKVDYKKITKIEGKTIGGRVVGSYLFLAPRSMGDQAIVINLRTFCCDRKINVCKEEVQNKGTIVSWDVIATDTGIAFTFYDTKYIIMVNPKGAKSYVADIPDGICSLSVWESELWILPSKGRNIYMADMSGKIKNTIQFISDEKFTDVSVFARIVATKNCIFLLPFSIKGIYVYLKKEKRSIIIKTAEKRLRNTFHAVSNTSSYWEYYIHENNIFFFPLENPYLIIDLDTLKWKEEDIFLPLILSDHNLEFWRDYNRMVNVNNLTDEYKTNMYELFLEYVKNFEPDNIKSDQKVGKLIWREIIEDEKN